MIRTLPCWLVLVTSRDIGGRRRTWPSRLLSYTDARAYAVKLERMGHAARLEEVTEVSELNLRVRRGEIDQEEADELAAPILEKYNTPQVYDGRTR